MGTKLSILYCVIVAIVAAVVISTFFINPENHLYTKEGQEAALKERSSYQPKK